MTESAFVEKWRLRFADNDLFLINEGALREFAQDIADTFGADDPRAVFEHIFENQYGKHPEFSAQAPLNAYVLQLLTAKQVLAASEAPEFTRFDDAANTVVLSHPLYAYVDLRYDLPDGSATGLKVPADGLIRPGNIAGQLVGYVRAAGGRLQSDKAYSPVFTSVTVAPQVQPAAPRLTNFDDVANTINVYHPNYSYVDLRYNFNGQTGLLVSADGLISVGNVAGQVEVYVVADPQQNRVQSLPAYSQPFTTGSVVITPPTPTPLAVTFTLPGGNTLTAGQSLSYSASASGGVAPYSHEVTATNSGTGTTIGLGSASGAQYSGIWQNVPAGEYDLVDTVTDAAGTVKISTSRHVVATAVSTTKATKPTGEYDATNRVYNVSIGTYPLSRLLVSTNYGAFVAASALSFAVGNVYRAPEYFRFKISAAGSETESDILASPVFTAPGVTLTKLPTGLHGYAQSNGIGFAHQTNATAAQRGPFPLGLIHNYVANALQPYEMGINDQGIRRTDFPAGTDPIYQDGFGAEAEYHRLVQASGRRQLLIKKSVRRSPLTPDGAGMAKWDAFLYAEYKEEIEQAKALAVAAGYELDIRWISVDIKESEVGNPDFAVQMHEHLDRFEADGLTTSNTKRFIMMGHCSQNYAAIRAMQEQLYQLDPSKYRKIDIGLQPDLGDGVHLNHVGQTAAGAALYQANEGLDVVAPPTGEVEETSAFADADYFTSYDVKPDASKAWATTEPNPLNTEWAFWLRDKKSLAPGTRGRTSFQFTGDTSLATAVGLSYTEGLMAATAMRWMFYGFKNSASQYRLAVHSSGNLLTDTIVAVVGRNYGFHVATDGTVTIQENTSGNLWKVVYTFPEKAVQRVYSVGAIFNNTRKLQTPRTVGFATVPSTVLPWTASSYELDADVFKAGTVYTTTGPDGFNNVGRQLEYSPAGGEFRTRFLNNHYSFVNVAQCFGTGPAVSLFAAAVSWYITGASEIVVYFNGVYQALPSAIKAQFGRFYGFHRTAAGVVTIEESGDGETWNPLYQFPGTYAADGFLGFDNFGSNSAFRNPEHTTLVPR